MTQNHCPFLSTMNEEIKCFNTCPFNKENEECPFKIHYENDCLGLDISSTHEVSQDKILW